MAGTNLLSAIQGTFLIQFTTHLTLVPAMPSSARLAYGCLGLTLAALAMAQGPMPWSFAAPRPARPPALASGPNHPVDAFVQARLQQAGLAIGPAAPRHVLIRRLSLDLTGLPPTSAEVDAFVADPAPDAYSKLVDRLLASPHYGERMAQHWLDLARYTDTNGYDFDTEREMWAWRDWVIEAFATDLPFAEFTTWQIAGDLLPNATLPQRIATGFHRNHAIAETMIGEPGEYQHKYAADRTATFATTWLGLTVGCAECHDHKFDPISQRDYYGLYAFFDAPEEVGIEPGKHATAAPFLQLPDAAQGSRWLELQRRVGEHEAARARADAEAAAALSEWCRSLPVDAAPVPPPGLRAEFPLDADSTTAKAAGIGKVTFVPGLRDRAVHLDGKSGFLCATADAGFRADQPFTLTAWVRPEADFAAGPRAIVGKVDEAREGRGWSLSLVGGALAVNLVADANANDALRQRGRDRLLVDRWTHVAATYDGSRTLAGLQLYLDGEPARLAERPATAPAPKPLRGDLDQDGDLRLGGLDGQPFLGAIDQVRLFDRALDAAAIEALAAGDIAAAAATPAGGPTSPWVAEWFHTRHARACRAERLALRDLRHQLEELDGEIARVAVMAAPAKPRPTRLLLRGDFTRPADEIAPAVPASLGALPPDAPANRLGLAQWLVRRDHPLVWRVAANRLWRLCFGHGLVETVDDFGNRGEAPSHPELLDWLAVEFARDGGSHKRLLKLLVTSATYQQASDVPADLLARDPDNRLLARASRWRLDAEALRDQALLLGGLLDRRVGGKSVRPWQPADLWEELSPERDRHRRGLYVQANRSVPFTTFALFDLPPREVCMPRRTQTTTPLQALALFNDPNFHAAAAGLAAQLLASPGDDTARLTDGFHRCTARRPAADELHVLGGLLRRQRGRCADELTAWTAVTAVLLNLDATLTRS